MKKILLTLLLMASGVNAFALTTVADQFPVGPSGLPWYSSLIVAWSAYTTTLGQAVAAGSQTVSIAANGNFSVQLTPTDSATPQFQYTAQYVGQGGTVSTTVQWTVPTSSYPLTLQQVQSGQLNGRTSLMLSQVRCPDCANGDLPAYNGSQFQAVNVSAFDAAGAAKTHVGHVCVEDYLTSAMNGDYGKAINAGVQAASLTTQTQLSICAQGDHPLGTQVVFDRPISFWMDNSRLVLQSSLQSAPVTISGATLTAGSETVTVPSTSNLSVGMAIGGIRVIATSYIQSIVNSTSFTLSLPAGIVINGFIRSGSATVSGVNSLRGIKVGQSATGYGIPTGTTITAINYANQAITLSNAATATPISPSSLSIGGTWTANLTAVTTTPAIVWEYNANALKNSEGQNIGGEMHGVWIVDPGFRTLTGVQGVQIYGWDRFKSDHLQVENLQGSPLILGGYAPPSAGLQGIVRESYFYDTELRDSGDGLTGQSCIQLMTGYNNGTSNADELNQIGFIGGQCVFNYGEGLTIGTFNSAHTATNGPRLIWLTNNFQIEGGSHVTHQNIEAPYDTIHILRAGDIYIDGTEIAVPGYGKSVVRVDAANSLSVMNSRVFANGKSVTYNVNVTNGSPTVTWVSGGNSGFDATGYWDGVGAQINDGAMCTPCNIYLLPSGAVNSGKTTLTLASNYSGTTGSATMTIGAGGYYFNLTTPAALNRLTSIGNMYSDPNGLTTSLLGLSSAAQAWNIGGGFFSGIPKELMDYSGPSASTLTVGPFGSMLSAINFFSTASISPAAVPAQTCSDQTFTLNGVVGASDHLYLSNPPAALGNTSAMANASAANTVNLHFCNSTAASITPPAGVYSFVDIR